jgi:hypothetical protein
MGTKNPRVDAGSRTKAAIGASGMTFHSKVQRYTASMPGR